MGLGCVGAEVRVVELGTGEDRATDVCLRKIRPVETAPREVCSPQVRSREVEPRKIPAREVEVPQVLRGLVRVVVEVVNAHEAKSTTGGDRVWLGGLIPMPPENVNA